MRITNALIGAALSLGAAVFASGCTAAVYPSSGYYYSYRPARVRRVQVVEPAHTVVVRPARVVVQPVRVHGHVRIH